MKQAKIIVIVVFVFMWLSSPLYTLYVWFICMPYTIFESFNLAIVRLLYIQFRVSTIDAHPYNAPLPHTHNVGTILLKISDKWAQRNEPNLHFLETWHKRVNLLVENWFVSVKHIHRCLAIHAHEAISKKCGGSCKISLYTLAIKTENSLGNKKEVSAARK